MHQLGFIKRVQRGAGAYAPATYQDLVSQVFDNIEKILNAKSGCSAMSEDYGLPDFNGIAYDFPNVMPVIERHIKTLLNRYEPRMKIKQLKSLCQAQASERVQLMIEGEIPFNHTAIPVTFQTVFTGNGQVLVRRS